jgi:dihydrofolate synthase/folylpolyglutamate synthase
MYTSPHLEKLHERFQINGRAMDDATLSRLTQKITSHLGNKELTQFEFLTVLAFLWFAEEKIDIGVIETGLGGRLDATNIMRNVTLSVVTNVDLDHIDWLGKTIRQIAAEKAGIIKEFVPVVTGSTGEALSVIRSVAEKKKALLYTVRPSGKMPSVSLGLRGKHQRRNAALVLKAIDCLRADGFNIAERDVQQGLERVRWPGRFEIFRRGRKNHQRTIVLDGAHNPAAMKVLVETLQSEKIPAVNILFGALKDKDIQRMVRILNPVVQGGTIVPVSSSRTASPLKILKMGWRKRMRLAASPQKGLKVLLEEKRDLPLLVTGSLYLVGDVRKLLH